MDFLLLTQPFNEAIGYIGKGDFELFEDSKVSRPALDNYNYMYAWLNILKSELIKANPKDVFSRKDYYLGGG